MNGRLSLFSASALVLSCLGCVQPQNNAQPNFVRPAWTGAPSATGNSYSTNTSLSVKINRNKPVGYTLGGREFTSIDAIRAAITEAGDRELSQIQPATAPLGSARLVLKVSNEISDSSEGMRAMTSAMAVIHEMQDPYKAKALEKSGLFDRLQIDQSDTPLPDAGDKDYVLWRDGSTWYIRYKDGPREPIMASGLGGWIASVQRDTKTARDLQAADGSMLVTRVMNNRASYVFAGQEYSKAHDVTRAFDAYFDRVTGALPPVAERVGGRAKIIIGTQYEPADLVRLLSGSPASQAPVVGRIYGLANAKARANALIAAKVFDSLVIERADVTDVKIDSFDVVIWQPSNSPGRWLFRTTRGDAEILPQLQKSNFEDWTRAVARVIRTKGTPT